jgi:hypothetical protein
VVDRFAYLPESEKCLAHRRGGRGWLGVHIPRDDSHVHLLALPHRSQHRVLAVRRSISSWGHGGRHALFVKTLGGHGVGSGPEVPHGAALRARRWLHRWHRRLLLTHHQLPLADLQPERQRKEAACQGAI